MGTNLIDECARRDAQRWAAEYGVERDEYEMANTKRMVAAVIADVLDILLTEGHIAAPVEPGPCWHDSGVDWPSGERPRCELLAGHDGAHTSKRPNGGEAVWTDAAAPTSEPS